MLAKTGISLPRFDALNKHLMLDGKGLAGYMTTSDNRHLTFAIYINHVPLAGNDLKRVAERRQKRFGQIATAIYSEFPLN